MSFHILASGPKTPLSKLQYGVHICVFIFTDLQVGQIAFRNTKSLNRIQSVVFDTAYTTNENLLICAPTGAGKTNIAMLTILHTIRQHIENGVIHRDKFKVNGLGQMFSHCIDASLCSWSMIKPFIQIQYIIPL